MSNTVVIADDVTGANDIGIMYTKAGLISVVYSYEKLELDMEYNNDVTIIDTNSRFCSYEEAYDRVYAATKGFDKDNVGQFYNKQCSVFRGNIGAEFDAMLDALEEDFAIVVLGFPDNKRTTVNSIHYVDGVKLEDSQFKNDPVHPMNQSNLVDILQGQTKRKVSGFHVDILDRGLEVLKNKILEIKSETNYLIIDVRDNDDLSLIAQAVKNEKIICGSSALGYYLGLLHKKNTIIKQSAISNGIANNNKVLCIAGSLTPQTKAQIDYMRNMNYPVIMLDTTKLFLDADCEKEKERIIDECNLAYKTSDMVVIHSMNEEADVKLTKNMALENGLDNTLISEMVSNTLSQLGKNLGDPHNIEKYIICGGDTSASFCSRFNINGMRVLKEIEAGLPTCQSITEPYYQLVLKSGSFGSQEFIEKAVEALRKE